MTFYCSSFAILQSSAKRLGGCSKFVQISHFIFTTDFEAGTQRQIEYDMVILPLSFIDIDMDIDIDIGIDISPDIETDGNILIRYW